MYGNKEFILNAISENCKTHTSYNSYYKGTKILSLEINMMIKSGQDIFILKFQESLLTGLARSADFLALDSWWGLWNFKIKFLTPSFVKKSPLIE